MDNQTKYFLLAIFIQALFPAVMLLIMFIKRLKAVKSKRIDHRYFKTYQNLEKEVPTDLILASNHYNNLFQMPLLFLILGALVVSLKLVDSIFLYGSWLFVLTRLIHSYIHIGSNYVPFRYTSFGVSCLVLLGMWFYMIGKVFSI